MEKRTRQLRGKYSCEAVDAAKSHIRSLLAKTDRELMRAFTGEGGADFLQYTDLDIAYEAITNFIFQQQKGDGPDLSDLQREAWFRNFLGLPPVAIS